MFSFDERSAEIYGQVRAALEHAGRPLADPDLRIAAIVLAQVDRHGVRRSGAGHGSTV